MAKHTKKNFYAVTRGRIAPAVCASWGVTNALVSGYPSNYCKGFQKLDDAISFMEENGHPGYQFFCGSAGGERVPRKGEPVYYAVANGEHVGVYECYQGGAEGEITGYSHSCHKVFRSWKEAEDFIEEYRITTDLVKRGSQDGDIGTTLSDIMNELRLD